MGHGDAGSLTSTHAQQRFDYSPLVIALVYAVVGALWILGSDSAVLSIVRDREALTYLQTAKGWFFVLASSILIYVLVDRRVRALKTAQQAEHATRETLEALIDASPYAIFTLDREGRVESWNASAERLFGLRERDAVGRPLLTKGENTLELFAMSAMPRVRGLIGGALEGQTSSSIAILARSALPNGISTSVANGSAIEARLAVGPVRNAEGGIRGVVVFARDVTDEHAAERERERLAVVIEATSDLVCIIHPSRRLLYLNAAGRRMLGIGPNESLDRFDSASFLAADEIPRRESVVREALSAGVLEIQRTLRAVDGSSIPVSQVLVIHRGADGEVEFIATIARDIRERLRQESALRQSQKMEAVGRLAGGVAHDFNNLLTVIMSCGELMLSQLEPEDPSRVEAREIVTAASRAARLTKQLLAYSRQQLLAVDDVDVNAVVRDLLEMLRRLVGDHVTLEERLDPHAPWIRVDRGQFEQVIVNLVVNARDAMPNGGVVTIRSAPSDHAGEHFALLEVSDNGIGMDEATRARVFEPFFTTKEMGSGTGLGLATVYGIVRQSGGEISVDSALGIGTTFRLMMPAIRTMPDERSRVTSGTPTPVNGTHAVTRADAGRPRILLVEDEPQVRRTTARMLREEGYDVEEVPSGLEALRVATEHPGIDLVLTDVQMPGMGGGELALHLTELGAPPRIVFMSGYTNDALVLQGALSSRATFLSKPFTGAELRKVVKQALDD